MKIVKRFPEKDICTRYRPRKLSEVYGNERELKAITNAFLQGDARPKVMSFIGTKGTGKTTLARILAMGLNCENGDTVEPCLVCNNCKAAMNDKALFIQEINCTLYNKVEDAERLSAMMSETTMGGRNTCFILDEAHYLTPQAQNLLLKDFEEPPKDTYVFVCTSKPEKFDEALFDRFDTYKLAVPTMAQAKLIAQEICEQEGFHHLDDDTQMQAFLNAVSGFSYRQIVKSIDKSQRGDLELITNIQFEEDPELFSLVQMFFNSGDFGALVSKIKSMDKFEHESFRNVLRGYAQTILLNTGFKNIDKSFNMTEIIDNFKEPYYKPVNTPKFYKDLFTGCVLIKGAK